MTGPGITSFSREPALLGIGISIMIIPARNPTIKLFFTLLSLNIRDQLFSVQSPWNPSINTHEPQKRETHQPPEEEKIAADEGHATKKTPVNKNRNH